MTRGDERALDPYGLVFHHGRWCVTGHDDRRGEVRVFRLDRITSVGRTEHRFRRPEGFDPVAHVAAGLAGVPHALDVEVVLHGPPDDVRRRLPRTLGPLEPHPDGTLLRARAEHADGMARMLAGLACGSPCCARRRCGWRSGSTRRGSWRTRVDARTALSLIRYERKCRS
ncbi:WYL domain-containing protein [Pseudonocardia sp.]|uniref:WYL domain-containing protein n=1 Tax=Pseudonocardia sp. TaxID=60912 RepID=UPI00260D778E|nr:WYL domain-containing protein [Pseudonocardia sp.]